MSERRALLDPEMYKISEEDSQDEEVLNAGALARYTEDVLRLGADTSLGSTTFRGRGGPWKTTTSLGHDFLSPGVSSWGITSENMGNNSNSFPYHHDFPDDETSTTSFSSAMQRFSGGNGGVSRYKILKGAPPPPPSVPPKSTPSSFTSRGTKPSGQFTVDPEGENLDWPETSTNSDSCLSSDDKRLSRRKSKQSGNNGSAINNNEFLHRTYFGEHAVRRNSGEGEARGDGEGSVFSVQNQHNQTDARNQTYNQSELDTRPHNHHRRNYQKRPSRRRGHRHSHHGAQNKESSSATCSDDSSEDEGRHESPCQDCQGSSVQGRRSQPGHRRREDECLGRSATSSEEVDDYESSYSDEGSSYDEEDDEHDYYDDEEENNEFFDDIVKFLSDGEVELCTQPDGDLFLVEYSGESEMSEGEMSQGPDHDNPPQQCTSSSRAPHSADRLVTPSHAEKVVKNVRRGSSEEVPPVHGTNSSTNDVNESGDGNAIPGQSNSTLASAPSTSTSTGGHFKKSGKGAKGKISKLLKIKRDSSKKECEPPTMVGHSIGTPGLYQKTGEGAESSSSSVFPSANQQPSAIVGNASTKPKVAAVSSIQVNQSGSGSGAAGAPEKVFRFKDEHGGETRTVFVDIPQTAGTGNLLGRRATQIENLLGIIPGRFSTPAQQDSLSQFDQSSASGCMDRIMVAGFVPDSVASRYRRIKIGDWLQSIDDIPVDHSNADTVIASRSMYGKRRTAFETEYLRLKLTLRRVAGCMVSIPTNDSDGASGKVFTRSSCRDLKWSNVSSQVQSNVAILYISSGNSNSASDGDATNCATDATSGAGDHSHSEVPAPVSPGQSSSSSLPSAGKEKSKDIAFCWPKETESKIAKALAASQGMFSTLYRLLWDVTGSHPIASKVVIDDCEMDVTYTSDDNGESLLLVAVVTSLSTFTLYQNNQRAKPEKGSGGGQGGSSGVDGKKKEKKIRWREPQAGGGVTFSTRVMSRIESLLKYQFGSFSRAFNEIGGDKVSRLLVNAIAVLNDLSEDFLFVKAPGNFLHFPNSIRSGIDDVLYSFETSDDFQRKSSSRRVKDSHIPIFHCHGSCLMYKGMIVTSHLEGELASLFNGWWRTQLGLWEGTKRNCIQERWKPVSRLALWQQTCLPRRRTGNPDLSSSHNPTFLTSTTSENQDFASVHQNPRKSSDASGRGSTSRQNNNDDDLDRDEQELLNASSFASTLFPEGGVPPRIFRSYSVLVGIGNFTLGFVLENLTDHRGGPEVPDPGWIRRAMATICRLYQSGLSRSLECWLEKQTGKEEFIELCGTSSVSSSSSKKTKSQQQHDKGVQNVNSVISSKSATGTLKKGSGGTNSILKNTADPSAMSYCAIHSNAGSIGSGSGASSGLVCTCPGGQSSSPFVKKNFMFGSSSSSSASSSSSLLGNSNIRSGIAAAQSSAVQSFDDLSGQGGAAGYEGAPDSDDADDMDDTTTGTGSDNSSFKWYESTVDNALTTGRPTGEVKSIRISRGNILFDYLQVEFGRGLMVSTKDVHAGWAAVIRHNFRQSATVIHHILHKAANARSRLEERSNDKKWVTRALAPISEHGVLFSCQVTEPRDVHKRKPRKREVNYWVVGRMYPEEREIYVCYEDGPMSQNLTEIAYKIALNIQ